MAVMWSDAMAHAILNAIVRQVAFPLPAACYAGLCTTAAEPIGTGLGSAVEAAFTGYARPQLTTTIMAAPSGRQIVSSGGAISFGTPTNAAEVPYPTLRWITLWSAVTGGTYLGYGQLTTDVPPQLNQALTISTSNLVIRQT